MDRPTINKKKRKYATPKYNSYTKKAKQWTAKDIAKIAKKTVWTQTEMKTRLWLWNAVSAYIGGGTVSYGSIGYGGSSVVSGMATGIVVSAADNGRVGNKIKIMEVQIDMTFQPGDNYNMLRLLLLSNIAQVDKSSLATAVTQMCSSNVGSGTQFNSPIDLDTYRVWMDEVLVLTNHDVNGAAVVDPKPFRHTVKFPYGFTVNWDTNLTEPDKELIFVAISDSAAIAHPGAVAGYVKILYKDL